MKTECKIKECVNDIIFMCERYANTYGYGFLLAGSLLLAILDTSIPTITLVIALYACRVMDRYLQAKAQQNQTAQSKDIEAKIKTLQEKVDNISLTLGMRKLS